MNHQQMIALVEIGVISLVLGIILTDILQCIKFSLISKGRWWKKYPYQDTANKKYTTKDKAKNLLVDRNIIYSQQSHQQNKEPKGKTSCYPKDFLTILRTATISGLLISFCHACIISIIKCCSNKNQGARN